MIDPSPVRVLPVAYQQLLDSASRRFEGDERVRGMWLGGSLGRRTADAASDLDVLLAVADDAYDDFVAGWRAWLADVTPTVLAEALPFAPGMYYSVTPGFERFDVVVEPVAALPETFFRSRVTVFDRDGLSGRVPPPEVGPGPSAGAVRGLITEYFRISAVETILVRDDWLLAREHVHAVGSLIYRLFVEANAPLPPMGLKQWSAKLTPDQRDALASLPTDAPDADGLRAAHMAAAAVFVPNAEALARRLDVTWPHDLEAAAASHLRRVLGLDEPYPARGGRSSASSLGNVRRMSEPRGPVLVETDGERGVSRVTLHRPDKLNALNDELRAGLHDAIRTIADRDDVRVVVLGGAGRAFSAGADLADRIDGGPTAQARRRATGRWQRLLEDLERLPQVTVARLHGHVIGGAGLLAAACDLRVAADDLDYAIPEVAIGIPLTWAGLPRLAREIGLPRTRDLVMTGRRLGAAEAEAWGLVHRVVPAAELDTVVDALVDGLLTQPEAALAMTVDGLRALGRAVSAPDTAWADPDLLRWSLRDLRG